MSAFCAVNTTLSVPDPPRLADDATPTTPKPNRFFDSDDAAAKTPTKDSFAGIPGQRPLPPAPYTNTSTPPLARSDSKMSGRTVRRQGSHRSSKSMDSSMDVKMEDEHEGGGSDGESVQSDSTRPSKKKKGQRFFCTDYPPCSLSFTRSEHLARHIRKHTGERPFQCHCSRRFSRLDNLRQHAQTVHVNEDIPGDSLAATHTRFQRQIRTERVRAPPGRARSSTLGSQGGHGHARGHARNLSTSSITSVSTTTSSIAGDEYRRSGPIPDNYRRSNPGMSAEAQRAMLSVDTYNTGVTSSPGGPQAYYTVGGHSPSGYSTPTSATFSAGTGSPRFSSGLQSPASIPRSVTWDTRTPGRRLSVPSAGAWIPGGSPLPPHLSQAPTGGSSLMSPAPPSYYSPSQHHSRRDSTASTAPDDWRRRTWHPGTHTGLLRQPGGGLPAYHTPDSPRPLFPQPPQISQVQQAQAPMRLPGIESFDYVQPALPRRAPSPMQLDTAPPATAGAERPLTGTSEAHARQGHVSWDLRDGLGRLDIANATPPREPNYEYPRPMTAPHGEGTPLRNKRHGWYNGPLLGGPGPLIRTSPAGLQMQQQQQQSMQQQQQQLVQQQQQQQVQPAPQQHQPFPFANQLRPSPDGSSSSEGVPTPSTSSVEINPAIMHSNGVVETGLPPAHEHHELAPPHVFDEAREREKFVREGYAPPPVVGLGIGVQAQEQARQEEERERWAREEQARLGEAMRELERKNMERNMEREREREREHMQAAVALAHGPQSALRGVQMMGHPIGPASVPGQQHFPPRPLEPRVPDAYRRLDALVAVATGEGEMR
ncbi:hypothetical protein EJ06DRAFT_331268 [Trichodelitschia bisporula]|uniref:C2H2-type domain-containing protein n=1 Tax=Trichodelitschia bisporula TaxID=703511 RepID=A0A6G1I2Q9_9PEZI|nr:hypothetical protein EJ06DRAFT_331268 [Trichodelitschia bisporula]